MKTQRKNLASIYLYYLASIYIIMLFSMTLFRLVLYWVNAGQMASVENSGIYLIQSLLIGVRFDNAIVAYIMALPVVVFSILALINLSSKIAVRIFKYFFLATSFIVLAITVINIPYFKYFFKHLDYSALNWMKKFGGDTSMMIFQEKSYYLYFSLFAVVLVALYYLINLLKNRTIKALDQLVSKPLKLKLKLLIPCLLLFGLIFVSIRGGVTNKFPLRVSQAYFCEIPLYNKLGVNPFFSFIKSYGLSTKKRNLIQYSEDRLANSVAHVQNEFGITNAKYENPISRDIVGRDSTIRPNIVLVLMESMSSVLLDKEKAGQAFTPNINRVIENSYYFDNFYSSGTHTNNAIVSSLYGYPTLFDRPMMIDSDAHYLGLPNILQNDGYENLFFITGDENYDYMNGFLLANKFAKVYSQKDYPVEKIVNTFGVRDDYLFEYGIETLREYEKENKNFLACFLTVTNHPPLSLPDDFKRKGFTKDELAVAFADYAIGCFFDQVQKEWWYSNTIFVFVGDHGAVLGQQNYDMALSQSHVPFIIHSPLFDDQPRVFHQMGGQIDIFPTIMGLLGHTYRNDGMGVDLLNVTRPYIYFASDTHLGCIDNEYFYFYDTTTLNEGLYKYRENSRENLMEKLPKIYQAMKEYSSSRMIVADYLIKNEITDDAAQE